MSSGPTTWRTDRLDRSSTARYLTSVDARPWKDGDEKAILELFQLSFGAPLSERYWRWRFLDNPSGSAVGSPAMTAWERYAQVLLLANEFVFID